MPMQNPNFIQENTQEQRAKLFNAMMNGSDTDQKEAFHEFAEGIQSAMMMEAKQMMADMGETYNDDKILVDRGVHRALTSKEKKFFNSAIDHQSFENLEEVFPETIIEDVFRNLTQQHPLLQLVDSQSTNALFKYIYSDPTVQKAFWGTIPSNIRQILLEGFKIVSFESYKLSGFIAITKGFFKLGPNWLANYVITLIREIMEYSLEIAIVSGDGHLQPIGMLRKLSGSVDGRFPYKEKVVLNDLTPTSLAGIRGALSKAKTDNGQICAIMNPTTYWAKIFPTLAKPDANNNWHLVALPTGDRIVQTHAVPENTIIFGNPRNYLLAISGKTELERYKETLAIDDLDLFIAKFFGTGVAKNANAFFIADVTNMPGASLATLDPEADVTRPGLTLNPPKDEENKAGLGE